jgi:cell division protein FtsL
MERIMLDFANGIEAKNYGLRKTSDMRTLLESLKILFPLVVIAGALSFHIWVRSQNIQAGYQNQQLINQEEDLINLQKELILEEQTLKDPKALEFLALGNLGMIIPPADRIILSSPSEEWDMAGSETLALGNRYEPSDTKAPSALN